MILLMCPNPTLYSVITRPLVLFHNDSFKKINSIKDLYGRSGTKLYVVDKVKDYPEIEEYCKSHNITIKRLWT